MVTQKEKSSCGNCGGKGPLLFLAFILTRLYTLFCSVSSPDCGLRLLCAVITQVLSLSVLVCVFVPMDS